MRPYPFGVDECAPVKLSPYETALRLARRWHPTDRVVGNRVAPALPERRWQR